jgi:hypothetical protein
MKTRKVAYSIICLLTAGYLASCTTSVGSLPYATGDAGDVLIVMRGDLWKGAYGDSVRSYLTEAVMGMPAPEPMFTLSHSSELSSIFRKFRNIVIINIDPGYERAQLRYKADANAKHQLIFNIDAPLPDLAIACLHENKDLIIGRFLSKDRNAMIEDYRRTVAKELVDKLREKNQVDIVIPRSYPLDREEEDFVWMNRQEGERNWHIAMWKYPYLRIGQLDTDSLISKMNAMTRKYIEGKGDGSYMAVEPRMPPVVKRFEKDGVYTVQMNGLWHLENGFMGGPFVSQTIVDTQRGQLVTALGFVFYPNRDKRHMIRQLEAILHSMMPAEIIEN